MFGMSFGELIIIMVVSLIVFGPERLPLIASKIGKFAAELKKASDSMRREFYNSVYIPSDELKTLERDMSRLVSSEDFKTCETEKLKVAKAETVEKPLDEPAGKLTDTK